MTHQQPIGLGNSMARREAPDLVRERIKYQQCEHGARPVSEYSPKSVQTDRSGHSGHSV